MRYSKTEKAKDLFEAVAQQDASKASVLDLLKRNPQIERQLPSSFVFNPRVAEHWIMVCDAI